jgi:hypothetical protein
MNQRNTVVDAEVSRALRELLPDKEAVIRVLDALRTGLRERPAGYRANRDEQNPDFLFTVPIPIPLFGRIRYVRFSVNDTTSPDHFFVEAVSMSG